VTGRVLSVPQREHHCNPGWTTAPWPESPFPERLRAVPPGPREFPEGTVWQCECGRAWVSTGPVTPHSPGFIGFRRERWLERRRRMRRTITSG
jgi:hypothetical protein